VSEELLGIPSSMVDMEAYGMILDGIHVDMDRLKKGEVKCVFYDTASAWMMLTDGQFGYLDVCIPTSCYDDMA
jgi:hypothetical protein